MADHDAIGKRGEAIVEYALLTKCEPHRWPLFDPHHLGEKCRVFDYLVGLVGTAVPMYFLAQVKATTRDRTKRHGRLKIQVTADDVSAITGSAIPAYLIGVDDGSEAAYVVSLRGRQKGVASIPVTYPLDEQHLRYLWEEVVQFWTALAPHAAAQQSRFALEVPDV